EGTRSYGLALTRHVSAAGIAVTEVEQPARKARRAGKSDAIDAELAARSVLNLPVELLAQPRADGDREALRILLASRDELTCAKTMQANRLHALLLVGDDTDRALGRGAFNQARLDRIARRRTSRDADRAEAIRRGECRRLARSVAELDRQLSANRTQLAD